ncbi:GvpL/GvpF family gas vesicle protein [Pseudonocardia spinosispora]|uniref:GvpL/GvpF family gas vesicle protein n=1 Tax=Pseudonocardia spinosispora TaxID=103441 RepID=UPI00040F7734|nr:GvpL/GvpF family gas vesicle protein [Pseudonocardia spinosispora]
MADTLVYVYAIGDIELSDSSDGLLGMGGAPVRYVVDGGLAAAVSTVDAAGFDEEALRSGFEDLRWLEDTARTHHTVVDALAGGHPVAPLRLATVYFDDAGVTTLLTEREAHLRSVLDRIRGRDEWGVKAFAVAPPEAPAAPPEPGASGPGTSYLLRRRAERDRVRQERAATLESADRVCAALAELAVACRRYPPQDARLTGYRDEMVLNATYLVDTAEADAYTSAVAGWDDHGLRLELTGPWAPYSFATLEQP